jgi:hypothetical protein
VTTTYVVALLFMLKNLCGCVIAKKKKKTTFVTFNGFVAKKNGDGNYIHLFWRCCCKEGDNINVVTFFYGGGVVKKVMAISGFVFCFLFFSLVLLVLFIKIEN